MRSREFEKPAASQTTKKRRQELLHPGGKTTEVTISSEIDPSSATTTVDGRDFFRKAKSVLSYDQFTQLLWNVKAYNTRDQSRQRTLDNVFQVIGDTHPDMYDAFEALLTVR